MRCTAASIERRLKSRYISAMPALADPRRERLAREYIRSGVGTRAYLKAGYKPTTQRCLEVNSSRALRGAEVKARIAELRRQMSYKTSITLQSLLEDLAADRALARELGQPAAAIQASVITAKLIGLMVDRKESGGPGDFASLSAEQVLAQVRADHGDQVAQLFAKALDKNEPEQAADIPTPESAALN